jgi:hypothetical protein
MAKEDIFISPEGPRPQKRLMIMMPRPDIVRTRVDFLQKVFPDKDRMDLQDALESSKWSMQDAIQKFADWRNCLEETVETSIDSDTDPVTVEIKG